MDRVSKDYTCPDPACNFAAAYLKDIRRHLATKKHAREAEYVDIDQHVCTVQGCSFSSYRLDNFTRHMQTKHHSPSNSRSRRSRGREWDV